MCMKRTGFLLLSMVFSYGGFTQLQDIEQLKLDLEKLVQMKTMLSSMYNGYTTISNGYKQVTSLAKGNFDLHKNYLDQLLQVAPPIKNASVVQTILTKQTTVIAELNAAYGIYLKSGLFSTTELFNTKMEFDQYKSLISKKLDQLNLVLTPGVLRISDQERISAIDRIDKDVGDALGFVRTLVKEQNTVAAARAQQKKDNNAMRAWYGLKK